MSPPPLPVIEVFASGPAKGGGIGQVIRYLQAENAATPRLDWLADVDPRGPGHWIGTLWRLPAACAHLAVLRLRHGRAPVVHVHLAGRLSTARKLVIIALARALGFPVAAHVHEYGYAAFLKGLRPGLRALIAGGLRLAHRIIVLGPAEADALPGLLDVPPERVRVIPNGTPQALVDRPRAAEQEPVQIAFVGALSDRKGVPELLAAAAGLPRERAWRVVLAGGGDLAGRRAIAEELGVLDRCVFLGQQDNAAVQDLLRRSRIFALPSYAEGFAIALLEAMAAGCAVVATPVGEQAQALAHGRNALVVPPGDVEALRAALLQLLADPARAHTLGAAAKETVAARFTTAVMLDRIAAVLAEAAAERSIAAPAAAPPAPPPDSSSQSKAP